MSKIKEALSKIKASKQCSSANKEEHIVLIDAMNMFCRSFTTINSLNQKGQHVGGLLGFLKSLNLTVKTLNPTKLYIVFEGDNSSDRRKRIFPKYKSSRKGVQNNTVFYDVNESMESFNHQLCRLIEYLHNLPVYLYSVDNFEADDIIGYLAQKSCLKSKVSIVSNDKDYLQLVNANLFVYNPLEKLSYNKELIFEKFQIFPHNFVTARQVTGDTSDEIPNVKSFQFKTLVKYFPMISSNEKVVLKDLIEYAKEKVNCKKPSPKYVDFLNSIRQCEINKLLMDLSLIEELLLDDEKQLIESVVNKEVKLNYSNISQMMILDGIDSIDPYMNADVLKTNFYKLNS